VYQRVSYHQTCFLKLVNEEAEEERGRRGIMKKARIASNQYSPAR
jgi:hypothetical protein